MNYTLIIVGFIAVVAIYMLYVYFTNNSLTSGLVKLNVQSTTKAEDLKDPASKVYSYEGWLFLSGQSGYILQRSKQSNVDVDFGLYVNGQTLSIRQSNTGAGQDKIVVTNNFPLQKWTYFAINVNGDLVEAYLNGKLVKTVQLDPGTISKPSSKKNLIVGDATLTGYITQLIRVSSIIDAGTVWKKYLQGNGLTNTFARYFMPYNINMTITKDDIVQRKINVI